MLLVMLLMVGVQSNKHKFGGYRLVYTKYSQVFVHFFVWCRISAINHKKRRSFTDEKPFTIETP